jgi:plasmid stabilization system protein ParE
MKIVFLESSAQDLAWFRLYYRAVFPDGAGRAGHQVKAMLTALAANPYLGHPGETGRAVRELSFPKTPFVLIYRVTPNQIEVLRLWDSRRGGGY